MPPSGSRGTLRRSPIVHHLTVHFLYQENLCCAFSSGIGENSLHLLLDPEEPYVDRRSSIVVLRNKKTDTVHVVSARIISPPKKHCACGECSHHLSSEKKSYACGECSHHLSSKNNTVYMVSARIISPPKKNVIYYTR